MISLTHRCASGALALLLASACLGATTVIPPTFAGLVDTSREIFVGRVVTQQARFVDGPNGRVIVTTVFFIVEDSIKGASTGQTSLDFLGGTVGDVTLRVAEMPQFEIGERDIVFVGDRAAVSPLVGFMHGRFRIQTDPSTGAQSVRTHAGRSLDAVPELPTRIRGNGPPDWTLPEVRAAILGRVNRR